MALAGKEKNKDVVVGSNLQMLSADDKSLLYISGKRVNKFHKMKHK